jgi:multidrug efflux pump subunit AcrA (membrane-fusion protein)
MKTFLVMMFVAAVAAATAIAQVDTAENVVNSTVRGTEQAARTVAHGVKKAADTVEDAVTPDSDARRVDVTVTDDRIDMPAQLKPGKTAFVVKNAGTTTQNFEVEGGSVDRKFAAAPKPGQTKIMHVILKRGTYTAYSPGKDENKRTAAVTLRVR